MKEPSKVPTQLNDKHLSVLYFQDYVKIEENLIKRTSFICQLQKKKGIWNLHKSIWFSLYLSIIEKVDFVFCCDLLQNAKLKNSVKVLN